MPSLTLDPFPLPFSHFSNLLFSFFFFTPSGFTYFLLCIRLNYRTHNGITLDFFHFEDFAALPEHSVTFITENFLAIRGHLSGQRPFTGFIIHGGILFLNLPNSGYLIKAAVVCMFPILHLLHTHSNYSSCFSFFHFQPSPFPFTLTHYFFVYFSLCLLYFRHSSIFPLLSSFS